MAITYATFNPSDKHANIVLSNGNLTATSVTGTVWVDVRTTIGVASGKWYAEIKYDTYLNGASMIGVANATASLGGAGQNFFGGDTNGLSYYAQNTQSTYYYNNAATNIGGTGATNVVIGIALDMDNHQVSFYNNGVLTTPSAIALGASMAGTVYMGFSTSFASPNPTVTANFGATAFAYSVPSGYNAGLYSGSADTLVKPVMFNQAVKRASYY